MQLQGCTKKSNVKLTQTFQDKLLRSSVSDIAVVAEVALNFFSMTT